MKPKKTLVAGIGQVGTFAARGLAQLGVSVVAADVNPRPGFFRRFGVGDAPIQRADIRDFDCMRGLMRRHSVDLVVLASGAPLGATGADSAKLWEVNVRGTENVARAALDTGVERLVFVSSLAVYGKPALESLAESAPLQPRSEYGRAKAAAEEILSRFRDRGLDVRILRLCGIYGPHPPETGSRSSRLIDELLTRCLSGAPLSIQAPRHWADEYLYVKDLSRAVAMAALSDGSFSTFNVGAGKRATLEDLCRALRRVAPGWNAAVEKTAFDDDRLTPPLDVSRIKNVLGFEPRYGLAEGLTDYLRETRMLS